MALLEYYYQERFKLTGAEVEAEPSDRFFTNLFIYGLIETKKNDDLRKSNGQR